MLVATTRAPWQSFRVVSTLMLVFLAGAASGAAAPAPARETLLERFNTELGLSQDQSQKISAVLADYTQYYQSLQDQLDDVRATGRTQILQILNPDQRVKFEKIMTDLGPQFDQGTSK